MIWLPVLRSTTTLSPLCILNQWAASPPLPLAYRSKDAIHPDNSSRASSRPRGFACKIGASASTVVSLTKYRVANGGCGLSGGAAGSLPAFHLAKSFSYSSRARS